VCLLRNVNIRSYRCRQQFCLTWNLRESESPSIWNPHRTRGCLKPATIRESVVSSHMAETIISAVVHLKGGVG